MRIMLLLIIFFSCGKNTKKEEIKEKELSYLASGTQQMIDSLSIIYSKTNFWKHPYASVESADLIEKKINELRQSNQMDWQLYIKFGLVCLNAGETEKALGIIQEAKDKFPQFATLTPNSKQLYDALAIAWLRKGEQDNCILNHSAESCVFPIKGKGVHSNREGSEKAIDLYKKILKVFPNDLESRWLINIAYMTLGEYPEGVPAEYLLQPKQIKSDYDLPEFPNIAMSIGLDINDLSGGIITDDFNGDGFIDILASSWGMKDQIRFFINDGKGSFIDKSETAGLKGVTGGLNLRQADYNNDGHLDFLIIRGAWHPLTEMGTQPNSLFKNNGDGTFDDVTIAAGLYSVHPTQTATWLDFDLDGDLDLFIGNETSNEKESHPCEFFLNNGDGTFTDIAKEIGLDLETYAKGVNSGDINNDNLPDLYISSMSGTNFLFVNRGGENARAWKFENISKKAGVELPLQSFATWFFDFDNDGLEDIYVASFDDYAFKRQASEVLSGYLGEPFQGEHPRLFKNLGDEKFQDITKQVKLDKAVHSMGCNYGDLDNDGFLDFYLGTGAPDYRAIVPNRVFRNNEGKDFQDVTTSGRFGILQKGHGVSFADFDNDGDQDIYSVIGGAYSGDVFQNVFYENPGNKENKWITIQLTGDNTINKSAKGARINIEVEMEDGRTRHIYSTVTSGASFGSNSLQQEIGLGKAKSIINLSVKWPDKKNEYTSYSKVEMGQKILISKNSMEIEKIPFTPIQFVKQEMKHDHDHQH